MYLDDNMHKSLKKNKIKFEERYVYIYIYEILYKTMRSFFHIKLFQRFVKFVNQILIFHVDKQLKLNDDELDEIRFVYNHLS